MEKVYFNERTSKFYPEEEIMFSYLCKIGCQLMEELSILHDNMTAFLHVK